jgi:hypothetical protein
MYRRRKFGLTDELLPGKRQVNEDQVAGGKRIAMSFVPADWPHLRPQKRSNLFAIALGEVEQIVSHCGIVSPRRVRGTGREQRLTLLTRVSKQGLVLPS